MMKTSYLFGTNAIYETNRERIISKEYTSNHYMIIKLTPSTNIKSTSPLGRANGALNSWITSGLFLANTNYMHRTREQIVYSKKTETGLYEFDRFIPHHTMLAVRQALLPKVHTDSTSGHDTLIIYVFNRALVDCVILHIWKENT